MYRYMRKRRKNILKGITFLAAVLWMLSACCIDSEVIWIPLTINVVSGLWLLLMAVANGATYIEVK